MLTISHLRTLLTAPSAGLAAVADADKQIIDSPDIMEGLAELAQRKGLPFAILFEEAFHYDDAAANDVPVTRFTQSIYVMRMASANDPRRPEEAQCFDDIRHIRALLLAAAGQGDPELAGWDRRPQRDFVSGAANYVGWKLKLTFVDNEDMSLDKWTEPETP